MQFKSYLNRDIGLIFAVSFLLSLIPTAFADAQNDDSILRDYLNAYPLEHLSYTDCLSEGILPVPPSCTKSNIKDACMGMPESIYDIPLHTVIYAMSISQILVVCIKVVIIY